MVSFEYEQVKYNMLISVLMIIIALLFLLYMGSSLVDSTREFWTAPL